MFGKAGSRMRVVSREIRGGEGRGVQAGNIGVGK